ncbi:SDR family NAD(P)-dependent oxidoreductase [Sphingomonas sp. BN140010]|uniref:SDR family NAD(P)-dependent oxidoreductase n=1 Tax=Sphingomonas arvum TaxID=2992113 RepID=A0ABT3JC58_9SPHN|nr:SDR family NAD(P)-dependent oxidoreductase [Sphingomonas sp. BN140010]MCW3796658.1 SDR family NAD(P)-dependent oxidoreductase [Sphingomonas sp. BN140010]
MKLDGRVAVITGAGSGIGRGIALACSRRGCGVAIADVSEDGLRETAGMIRGVKVTTHKLDVTDRAATAALPQSVLAEHGRVDLLVNNAGVAIGGTFEQVDEADFDWLMEVNFHAVVRLTRAFLPLLRTRDQARIVNVSSLFGLIAPPGQTAYSAAKFAVRGFSESLRRELEEAASAVGVTVVHPGGINTNIARNARPPRHVSNEEAAQMAEERDRFQKFLRMSPIKAGEIIVSAVEGEKPRVLVGNDAKIGSLIERLAPIGYWNILKRSMS